jgi:hypothetical protein
LLLLLIPDLLSANYYYLSLLLPGGAALSGLGLARLAPNRTAYPLLAIVLTVFATGAISSTLPLYNDDRDPRDLGVLLNHLTAPADLIVGETGGSPNMLYFADRRGWMLAQQYDAGLLRQLANAGALYYADPSTADLVRRREFFRAMDANFERLTTDEGTWPIYRLSAPSEPLRQLLADEIRNPLRVNFGGQIELLGVSLRELAQSPTSFELLYFWRCLKESATDLQVIVRVAHPTGEIAYQSTRTPLAGSHSSAKWKLGEIIRERNIVVLPALLPKGMYQICVSWSDPVRAARLAILKSEAKNEQDCAQVGQVEIRQTPNYGWFAAN